MIFETVNASFSYKKNSAMLLKNINLNVESNEVLAILGPNGIGKTTLLKCMTGLLHWKEGFSSIDKKRVDEMSSKDFFSITAYVPQARNPAFAYKSEEFIMLGRSIHVGNFSKPGKKDYEKVNEVIELLALQKLVGKFINRLSGGELQMLLIARALCQEPSILILDEPESNLDFKNQLMILDSIRRLADKGMICIFNTHYPSHAFSIGDKAIMIGKNSQNIFGSVETVLTKKNIETVFGVNVDIAKHISGKKEYTTITALSIKN